MRAVALDTFGGPEALKIQNLPLPQIEAFRTTPGTYEVGMVFAA